MRKTHGTCKVVQGVVLEHVVQDPQQLPHLGGDGLARQPESQRQDLLVELWRDSDRNTLRLQRRQSNAKEETLKSAARLKAKFRTRHEQLWQTVRSHLMNHRGVAGELKPPALAPGQGYCQLPPR